jgi:hypothetical protein
VLISVLPIGIGFMRHTLANRRLRRAAQGLPASEHAER